MAKIVSTNQRIVTGVTNPGSVYSRAVSCGTWFKTWEPSSFGYTLSIGQTFYLRSVRVWYGVLIGATTGFLRFNLYTGQSEPRSLAEVRAWDRLLVQHMRGTSQNWVVFDKTGSFAWSMNQLFTVVPLRFAIEVISSWDQYGYIQASFEISEG